MTTCERTRVLTWERLCELEPRLRLLEAEARAVEAAPGYCAHRYWFGRCGFKARMSRLVGWEMDRPALRPAELGSPVAYDIAYQTLYWALPDCNHPTDCCG